MRKDLAFKLSVPKPGAAAFTCSVVFVRLNKEAVPFTEMVTSCKFPTSGVGSRKHKQLWLLQREINGTEAEQPAAGPLNSLFLQHFGLHKMKVCFFFTKKSTVHPSREGTAAPRPVGAGPFLWHCLALSLCELMVKNSDLAAQGGSSSCLSFQH